MVLAARNLTKTTAGYARAPYIRHLRPRACIPCVATSSLLPCRRCMSDPLRPSRRSSSVLQAHDEKHAASTSAQSDGTVPNPYEWPSLDNLGMVIPNMISKKRPEWWLGKDTGSPNGEERPAVYTAYEKLDGTNVGMVASTGALLGRRFCTADDASTYQGARLQTLRAHWDNVKAVERAILSLLAPELSAGAQAVVYGELLFSSQRHEYAECTVPLQAEQWYVFGEAILLAEGQNPQEVRAQLLQHGLAVTCSASRAFIYLNNAFEALVLGATQGKLLTTPALCQPCSSLYDMVHQVHPSLLGEAASLTEGAVVVGVQDQIVFVAKWKAGHSDDSLSADKLEEVLASEVTTDGSLSPQSIELLQALSAVANLNRAISREMKKQLRRRNAPASGGASDPRFQAAFNSALTKIDDLSVWAQRGEVSKAIAVITSEVQADLLGEGADQEEADKLAAKVKAAVGQCIAKGKSKKAEESK